MNDSRTPEYSKAQELFLTFFHEACSFLDFDERNVKVWFGGIFLYKIDLFGLMVDYENGELYVPYTWPEDKVANYQPTRLRIAAYYYAYGFYKFNEKGVTINTFPQDIEASNFAIGLCYLNGVSYPISSDYHAKEVGRLLCKLTGKKFKFEGAIGSDGIRGYVLVKDDLENTRLGIRLKYFREEAKKRRLKIEKGSKDNPFSNIEEAIQYIETIEQEAVEEDLFLNSEFITDKYRYDFGLFPKRGYEVAKGFYKIPWASAYTAHYPNDFPKHSFVITQLALVNDDRWLNKKDVNKYYPLFALKPNLSRRRFLFRGQTEEYLDTETGKPVCLPNLYREDVVKNPLPHRIKAYEMACLTTRHPLAKCLGVDGVKIFNEPFKFQLNILGLAQHYYNKTDFLDLTSDINTAKFFATTKYDWESDSYVEYTSDEKLGVLYIYDMRLPGEFNHTRPPQLSCIGKQYLFQRSAMQSGFLLKMPKGMHLHELPNVYRIYFRHDVKISRDVIEETDSGKKYFPNDELSRYWKKIKDKPNSDFSISGKAREMYLRFHQDEVESLEEVDSLLIKEGFKLGQNDWPLFPDDILNDYYANSIKAWEQFCSDIYFLGSEGYFMKKALLELPKNPEYKDAFFKK